VILLERLRALYPEASHRSLKQWLETGRVALNGRPCHDGRLEIRSTDTVVLTTRRVAAFPRELALIHEDDALLVVVKAPGLLTIATDRERERTAYRLIWDYLAAKRERPFIVHRLDRETSGLLVFAKSEPVKRALQAQFEARSVERIYLALVEGRPSPERGTLESRLAEDRMLRVRSAQRGRPAITHYRVLGRRREGTLLELRLGTGRRRRGSDAEAREGGDEHTTKRGADARSSGCHVCLRVGRNHTTAGIRDR